MDSRAIARCSIFFALAGGDLVTFVPSPASAQVAQPTAPKYTGKSVIERLTVPAQVPGSQSAEIALPGPNEPREKMEAALQKYFPPLPALAAEPIPAGAALSLADLQRLAAENSPTLRQASADIASARGVAWQAGLPSNPVAGFQADTINTGSTRGYQGGFIATSIKAPGKLKLAQLSAIQDVQLAEIKMCQVQSDLRTQVRGGYFAVVIARENLKITRALTESMDEVYDITLLQLKAGQIAVDEVLQARLLAVQSRASLTHARSRYLSAWKQLSATVGLPNMPLADLDGRIDLPIPRFEYSTVLEQVLNQHTDMATAMTGINKAQFNLQLAQIQPRPDVFTKVVVQHDFTTPPFNTTANIEVGFALPLWDRNQGNIRASQAALSKASDEIQRVRNELSSKTAEAFERYDNNLALVELYRDEILPKQVQALRAVVARHARAGDADKGGDSYADIVAAEQNLIAAVTSYLGALRDQWQAVVDVANLLQAPSLFSLGEASEPLPTFDVQTATPHFSLRRLLHHGGIAGE